MTETKKWKIGYKNRQNGWHGGEEGELPESNRHFMIYDYYDGPHYLVFYVNDKREYFRSEGFDGPEEYCDTNLLDGGTPWRYVEEFDNN